MICPYRLKTATTATLIQYKELEDGTFIENGSIVSSQYINTECPKEQCGAWHKGKCKYKF